MSSSSSEDENRRKDQSPSKNKDQDRDVGVKASRKIQFRFSEHHDEFLIAAAAKVEPTNPAVDGTAEGEVDGGLHVGHDGALAEGQRKEDPGRAQEGEVRGEAVVVEGFGVDDCPGPLRTPCQGLQQPDGDPEEEDGDR